MRSATTAPGSLPLLEFAQLAALPKGRVGFPERMDRPLKHPLPWWTFYGESFRYAGSGFLGVIGDTGTILGVCIIAFKWIWPSYYATAATYLNSHGYRENLLIELPLWFGLSILALRLLAAPYVLYRDKPMAQPTALDVRLEGTYPDPFSLRATGDVCEIRIGPIVQESGTLRTETQGQRTIRTVMPRYEIEFRVISDLCDRAQEVVPSLVIGEGYRRGTWPEKEAKRTGMTEFFRNAAQLRRVAIGEPDTSTCTSAEMDEFAERVRRPLSFPFDITFWNTARTQQWRRTELLVYDPKTDTAFVRHSGSPTLIPPEPHQLP